MQNDIMFQAYGGIFLSAGMEKGIKYNHDQSSIIYFASIILRIMLLF